MHRERQVERRFVFGLLWPHISPLRMNINKVLLISAACAVRACVYARSAQRHTVWTSLPPPPCASPPPLPHNNLYLLHLLPPPFLLLLMWGGSIFVTPPSFFCSDSSSQCVPRLSPFPAIQRVDSDAGTGFIMIKYSVAYFFGSHLVNFTHQKYVRKKTKYAQGNVVS